jgi:filamentous hemagglutinin family protein
VNAGNVAISTQGAAMTIQQNSAKASVNWNSFNIGSAAAVNITQPNANSVLLNRVVGNDPSQIFGKLSANGQVVLINPNGVVFGQGGSVTASAFTASTFGLSDDDFAKGKYNYTRNGSTAGVTVHNGSSLNATAPGGYVALIGASVNNEGTISTKQGSVILAAGESAVLPSALTDNVSVPLSSKVRLELSPAALNASISNSGAITTEGGQVLVQAAAISDAVASISHSGSINTTGAQGGAVTLQADGGIIQAHGSIKANSTDAQRVGGDIIIGRDTDTGVLAKATDVSGATLESVNGFIETSAHHLTTNGIAVSAKDWLLDPDNIDITGDATAATAGYSKIKATDIATALNLGTNVTVSTTSTNRANQPAYVGGAVTGDGNILVSSDITKLGSNNASLSLLADNGIIVNARIGIASGDITSTGKLDVNMTASGTTSDLANSRGIKLSNTIDANGGIVKLTGTSKNTAGAVGGTWDSDNTLLSGIVFDSTSSIKAANYEITGVQNAPTSWGIAGVIFNGGTTTLSSTTSNSFVRGTKNSVNANLYSAGVHFRNNSTVSINTGSGTSTISGNNTRVSTHGTSVGIYTNGNVTLGSLTENMSVRGSNVQVQSGSFTLLGSFIEMYNYDAGITGAAGTTVNLKSNGNINLSIAGESGGWLAVGNNGTLNIEAGGDLTAYRDITAGNTGGSVNIKANVINLNGGNGGITRTVSGNTINLQATNLNLNSPAKLNAAGTIYITNKTTGKAIQVGGVDDANTLGISQNELDLMTASKVVIGSTATSALSVTSAITTLSATGDIALVSNGNIGINAALTVGNATRKNLTLDSGGTQVTQTAGITAAGLNLLGSNAAYTLNNSSNSIQKLAANTQTINLTNNAAFVIDTIGTTAGVTTTGNTTLRSTNHVTQAQKLDVAGLELLGVGGNYDLAYTANNVRKIAANTGVVKLTNNYAFAIDTVNTIGLTTSGNTTFSSTAAVTQNQKIVATGLELLGANGLYTLTHTDNNIQTLAANTGSVTYANSANFTVGSVNTSGITTTGDLNLLSSNGMSVSSDITTNGHNIVLTANGNGVTSKGFEQTAGMINAGAGDISITGTSKTASGSPARIGAGIHGTVTGRDIQITGTSNTTSATDGVGVQFEGASSVNASGTLSVQGEVKGGGMGRAVWLGDASNSTAVFNASNDINITGTLSSSGAGNANNAGVFIDTSGVTASSSNGAIRITGDSTAAGNSFTKNGVYLKKGLSLAAQNGTTIQGNATGTGASVYLDTATNLQVTRGDLTIQTGGDSTSNAFIMSAVGASISQSSNADVTVITQGQGNITAPKISNSGSGDVVIAAGSTLPAGTETGGQVLTLTGNGITQSSGGKTYIYTGSPANTGALSNLSSDFANLYYQGARQAVNTGFNKAFDSVHSDDLTAPAGGSVSSSQVLFRSSTKPGFSMSLSNLSKQYGDADPTLASAYTGPAILTNALGNNTFAVYAADVLANLSGTARQTGETLGTYTFSGLSAAGYNTTLSTASTPLSLTIHKRDITLASLTAASREYDGTSTATITGATFNNLVAGETLTLSGAGTFIDANFGLGKTVSTDVTQLSKSGSLSAWNNYNLLDTSYNTTANITKAPLTIKVNDTAIFVTQDASTATNQLYSYTGFKNGENEASALTGGALVAANRSYTDPTGTAVANRPSAGTYTDVYGLNIVPTANNNNYAITVQKGGLTVTPADKLLITIGSQSDSYGSRTAGNAGLTSGNSVSAQYCLVATNCNGANLVNLTMTQLSVNEWKATDITGSSVVFSTTLRNPTFSAGGYLNAGNYTYNTTQINPISLPNGNFTGRETNGGVLNITPIAATFASDSATKIYDGTTNLIGTALSLSNPTSGDAVYGAVGAGTSASKDVGHNMAATFTHISLSGADAANYYLTSTTLSGTATITPKPISLIGVTAANKVFDGTTLATLTSDGSLYGLVGLETLSVSGLTGSFDTAAIGTRKTVKLSALLSNGANGGLASNYLLQASTTTADITAASSIVHPTRPVLPSDNSGSAKGRVSSNLGGNPYLSNAQPHTDSADRCSLNANNSRKAIEGIDDYAGCLCETQNTLGIDGLSICYEPKQTADNKTNRKPRI